MSFVSKKNFLLIFSYFLLASFVICYLTIGFYNRHCADDYDAIYDVNTYGIWGSIKHLYLGWEGSYTQGLVYYSLTSVFKNSTSLFWYHVLSLLLLFVSFSLLLSHIGKTLLGLYTLHFPLLCTSVLATLFFTSPRLCEVWYWFCGSASYLWPLILLFFALYFLLKINANKWNLFFACVLFFLFAGSRLNYPIIVMTIYFAFLFKFFLTKRKIDFILLLPFLCLIAGILIYVVAPGNYVRRSYALPRITDDSITFVGQMVKGVFRIVLYNNTFQLPYIIVFLSPMFVLGATCSKNISEKIKTNPLLKTIIFLFGGYFILIVIHTFIMNFSLGDAGGSPRTRLLLHLIFICILAFSIFMLGVRLKEKNKNYFILQIILLCAGITLFFYKLNHELPINRNYANAVDKRMKTIIETKRKAKSDKIDILYLPLLPASQGFTFDDPGFSEFKKAGIINYIKSIPNGSLHTSDIGKRKSIAADTIIDVFRKDHINVKLERAFHLPYRIDVDTLN